VTITCCLPTPELAVAVAGLPGIEVVVWDGARVPPAGLADVSFLVAPYSPHAMTPQALAHLPRLAAVQLLSAGFDGWQGVLPPGVVLCNGRGIHGGSTAELAVCGLLMTWHHSAELLGQQQARLWLPIPGLTARGMSVVVIGAGDIGSALGRQLTSLGARPTLVGRSARDGVSGVADLPELAAGCDAVVAAVPLTEATRGLIDAALLRRMPDGGCVVNVARGPVVNTGDLVAELRAGRLRAVLDVVDPEPLPADHELWGLPGVILTPHVGGGAAGWTEQAGDLVRAQLVRFAAGESLANVVDL
jgi:phosphoglycerate dehydrogenase-like enzyme